jgi:CCR4-NOT transcription complex subunit 1
LIRRLLDEWLMASAAASTSGSEKAYASYLTLLHSQGLVQTDADTERFLRVLLELCVDRCPPTGSVAGVEDAENQRLSYTAIDALGKLVVVLIKYSDPSTRVPLLGKILSIVASAIMRESAASGGLFDSRPYFRLLLDLIQDLNVPEQVDGQVTSNVAVLAQFASCLHAVSPSRVPAFAFGWLHLLCHPQFLPHMLMSKGRKGWPLLQRLVVDLLRYLEPQLRTAELTDALRLMYKGALRLLLVLLHDFPEFLVDYHFCLCDALPPLCVQMRNLVLSAFPRHMRLPDPFTPNLKVDLLSEISVAPSLLSDFTTALAGARLNDDLDAFLKTQRPTTFCRDLPARLRLPAEEWRVAGTTWNVPAINALVLYLGVRDLAVYKSQAAIMQSAPKDIFHALAAGLPPEGRYHFLNAIANQLRYPNSHTHYFSYLLLYLFAQAESETVREQITRVLLERLIVHRPHPWGLLITFIELIKNARYNFWGRAFTRCAPDIERLFESVARSCMTPTMAVGPLLHRDVEGGLERGTSGGKE